MKDPNDNKTQDWLEVTMPLEVAQAAPAAMKKVFMDWEVGGYGVNQSLSKLNSAAVLDRGINVLLAVKNTPVATASEIQQQVMPDVTKRAVQRYLKNFIEIGLLYAKAEAGKEYRYYLTGKAKQLFGVKS